MLKLNQVFRLVKITPQLKRLLSVLLNKNWEVQFKGWIPINEIYQKGYFLVNTEILRLDHETDPQHAFVLIIFQKVLTVTIIILQEEILVLVIIKLIAQLDLSVKAEPSLSFGQDNPAVKAPVVCPVIGGYLEYNQYKSMLRIGFVIKPQDFSIY